MLRQTHLERDVPLGLVTITLEPKTHAPLAPAFKVLLAPVQPPQGARRHSHTRVELRLLFLGILSVPQGVSSGTAALPGAQGGPLPGAG